MVDQSAQQLKGHVATLQWPLVVLFEQHRAGQARDGGGVGEDASGGSILSRFGASGKDGSIQHRAAAPREGGVSEELLPPAAADRGCG